MSTASSFMTEIQLMASPPIEVGDGGYPGNPPSNGKKDPPLVQKVPDDWRFKNPAVVVFNGMVSDKATLVELLQKVEKKGVNQFLEDTYFDMTKMELAYNTHRYLYSVMCKKELTITTPEYLEKKLKDLLRYSDESFVEGENITIVKGIGEVKKGESDDKLLQKLTPIRRVPLCSVMNYLQATIPMTDEKGAPCMLYHEDDYKKIVLTHNGGSTSNAIELYLYGEKKGICVKAKEAGSYKDLIANRRYYGSQFVTTPETYYLVKDDYLSMGGVMLKSLYTQRLAFTITVAWEILKPEMSLLQFLDVVHKDAEEACTKRELVFTSIAPQELMWSDSAALYAVHKVKIVNEDVKLSYPVSLPEKLKPKRKNKEVSEEVEVEEEGRKKKGGKKKSAEGGKKRVEKKAALVFTGTKRGKGEKKEAYAKRMAEFRKSPDYKTSPYYLQKVASLQQARKKKADALKTEKENEEAKLASMTEEEKAVYLEAKAQEKEDAKLANMTEEEKTAYLAAKAQPKKRKAPAAGSASKKAKTVTDQDDMQKKDGESDADFAARLLVLLNANAAAAKAKKDEATLKAKNTKKANKEKSNMITELTALESYSEVMEFAELQGDKLTLQDMSTLMKETLIALESVMVEVDRDPLVPTVHDAYEVLYSMKVLQEYAKLNDNEKGVQVSKAKQILTCTDPNSSASIQMAKMRLSLFDSHATSDTIRAFSVLMSKQEPNGKGKKWAEYLGKMQITKYAGNEQSAVKNFRSAVHLFVQKYGRGQILQMDDEAKTEIYQVFTPFYKYIEDDCCFKTVFDANGFFKDGEGKVLARMTLLQVLTIAMMIDLFNAVTDDGKNFKDYECNEDLPENWTDCMDELALLEEEDLHVIMSLCKRVHRLNFLVFHQLAAKNV